MKYLNIILAVVLVSIVAVNADQKTSFSQREVRDPRLLAAALEANATDAQTRVAAIEAIGVSTTTVALAASAIQPTTADYTNAVALAISAVQTEADPVVAAIVGIVKSDGTNISAATAGTDYLATDGDGSGLSGVVTSESDPVASPVINDLIDYLSDGLLADGTLTISGENAAKFKTTTTAIWTVGGVAKAKVATDELVFSAADTINVGAETNTFYGAWLIEVDADGAVATKPAGGLVDQVYEASATAIAALPAPTSGSVALGYVVVTLEATGGETFTANTTALTSVATFVDGDIKTLPSKL